MDVTTVFLAEVRKFVESTFRQVADLKGLELSMVLLETSLPPALGQTDPERLPAGDNLLSNASSSPSGAVSRSSRVATARSIRSRRC